MILPWVLPLLHIVCYLCTAGAATCVGAAATLYCMLCTAGTGTCVDTAVTLYCMLGTAGTGSCVDTASTLYCMLCTVGATTYVGSAAALYCMLCILCSVGDATCVRLHYAGNFTHVFKKKLLCFECAAYMLHGHVLM